MDKEKIKDLCYIARLNISDEELSEFTVKFNNILEMIEIVNELEDKDIEKTYQVHDYKTVLRDDEECKDNYLKIDEVMANSPESKYGYFKIKRVVE